MNPYYPNLFSPLRIKNTRFKNRIFSAPNFAPWVTSDHRPDDNFIRYYETKAKGGAASVCVPGGTLDIDSGLANGAGKSWLELTDNIMPRLVALASAIRQHGAVPCFQLAHGGLYSNCYDGKGPVGPSPVMRWDGVQVREMTIDMMNVYADSFARGAQLIKKAGFEMVQIHAGHGWMFSQFLAPEFNHRTDEYGCSLENRARFPIMVIDRVREAVGDDFLIEYRISGDELAPPDGYTLADSVEFCKMIQDKVDIIHVSAARDSTDEGAIRNSPTIFFENGCNLYMAEAIKKAVNIPVLTIGAINTPELAEQALREGKADIIGMARAIIADPAFPNKAKHGLRDEINPCLRCLNCLTGEHERDALACDVNPVTGHECRFDHLPKQAEASRSVVVIGGGPAGMKAAITAAERGHSVTLLEKENELGGILRFTDYDELKVDLRRYKNHLVAMTRKMPIDVRLGVCAEPELVRSLRPDHVIIATGSVPAVPEIPGLREHAKHVLEVYCKNGAVPGERVVLLGGGMSACETAVDLARRGHKVTIVGRRGELAPNANWMQQESLKAPIEEYGIEVYTGYEAVEVRENGALIRSRDTGAEVFVEGDSVLYALGMRANTENMEEFYDCAIDADAVGDCVSPRHLGPVIHEAFYAALDIE